MSRKNVDLSELYDLLKSRTNSYVLCFDIINLKPINDTYGHEAGDKAILECLRRIDSMTDDSCILFRIGGDEFALVTDYKSSAEVEVLVRKILSKNGETIEHNHNLIPIGMRVGCTRLVGSNIRYNNLYADLNRAIETVKESSEYYIIA